MPKNIKDHFLKEALILIHGIEEDSEGIEILPGNGI